MSYIGNFEPDEALALLRDLCPALGADGALVIGVDLKKARRLSTCGHLTHADSPIPMRRTCAWRSCARWVWMRRRDRFTSQRLSDQPQAAGLGHGLRAIGYIELHIDVAQVEFHRALGHGQDAPHFPGGFAFHDPVEHFPLLGGERFPRTGCSNACG